MSNAANTSNDRGDDEQPINALNQWLADNEPLSRAAFDRLRSAFVRTVGESVTHPIEGRSVHFREAEAEAFGRFAFKHEVALAELDADARYGDLHGYPVVDGTGWVPVLVTTDESGGVIEAAHRIQESYQALGTTTSTSTSTSIDTETNTNTNTPDTPVGDAHGGTLVADGGTTPAESHPNEPPNVLNENALVGLAADDDELSWRYKSALAPDSYKRHDESGEIDDEYYTKTRSEEHTSELQSR